MNDVIQAASELQAVCQSQDRQSCFIGGLALQRWGEPRETVDVDLTLLTGFGGEEPFIQTLLRHFEGKNSLISSCACSRAKRYAGDSGSP